MKIKIEHSKLNIKEVISPTKRSEITQIIEEEDKKLDEAILNSPKQDSERGIHTSK